MINLCFENYLELVSETFEYFPHYLYYVINFEQRLNGLRILILIPLIHYLFLYIYY